MHPGEHLGCVLWHHSKAANPLHGQPRSLTLEWTTCRTSKYANGRDTVKQS
jgi:hypothetical protein